MPIRYHCPQCRQLLSISSRKAGESTQCPNCRSIHNVPLESEPPPAPRQKPRAAAPTTLQPPETEGPVEGAPTGGVVNGPVAIESVSDPPVSNQTVPSAPIHGSLDPAGASASPFLAGTALDDRARHWADEDEDEEGLVIQGFERKSDELDLIPMVDCVFLLLVFYMITASYALQKMIDMAAPAADKKGAVQSVQTTDDTGQSSIIVQIDAQNRVLIDDTPVPNPADIADLLRTKMNGDQKNVLVIQADPRAFHETVVAVTDAAKDLPFQHVRMAVKSGDED
ncbi:MAG TPA: biopolymer transporter ExbD [Planctomycetaceae bacterium]|nr:biopolymer transporter ExbD [Planctomycetaceae bacterium]